MKITCPECATSYRVKESLIGQDGRSVKCARCGARWIAHAEDDTSSIETELPEETAAEARAPALAETGVAGSSDAFAEAGDMDWSETLPANSHDTPPDKTAPFAAASGDDDPDDDLSALMEGNDSLLPARIGADAGPDGDAADHEPPVDIESLARRPKIHVKPKEDEPALKRIASAAAQRARQVRPRRLLGGALFGLALALFALALVFRTPIVARMPDLAGLYALAGLEVNLRGLEFRDLRTFRELEDGTIVLVIEGTIENISREPAYVPAVRFALRSEDAQEIYAWIVEPRMRRLDTGTTTRIRTRLASPPDLAADIHVRFVERGHEKQAHLR